MSSDPIPHRSRLSSFREKLHSATRHLQKRESKADVKADVKAETRQNENPPDASQPQEDQAEANPDETKTEAITAFDYTPLKPGQIRLVTLHPGPGELMCSVTVVDIPKEGQPSTMPPYDGVSYVWGDIERPHGIKCNYSDTAVIQGTHYNFFTLNTIQHVKVTSNLKALLLRLRDYEEWGTFWIDSICINQEDIQERSEQVRLMDRIYARARNVLIWLGEEDEQTPKAFQCVQSLIDLKDLPYGEAPWQNLTVGEGRREGGEAPLFLPLNLRSMAALDTGLWDAFVQLFKRPWFHRAWVFQEVVMASKATVICGEHSLPWDTLYASCQIVESSEIYRNDPKRWSCLPALNMGRIRQSIVDANKGSDPELWENVLAELIFEKLLRETRSAQATDPRDKVYALLGLAQGEKSIMPQPDYSISVRDTYLKVAKYWFHVKSGNDLTFLNYVQGRNEANNLPSWVPDWSVPATTALLASHNLRAAGDSTILATFPSHTSISSTSACLTVRGVRLLTVKAVEVLSTTGFAERHHAEMISPFSDPYPTTTQSYLEVYPKALNPTSTSDFKILSEHKSSTFWPHISACSPKNEDPESLPPRYTQADLDKTLTYSYCVGLKEGYPVGRRFFVSNEGLMGLVPDGVAAGDEICILFGGYTPFVIRRLEGGNYEFIGECYVHGLMNGEAMEELEDSRAEDLVFE